MKNFGYARVSSKDQNLARQMVELEKYVEKDNIFTDKISGKDFDRPNYKWLRKILREGDILYIKSLDRLGRNKQQIKLELEYFKVTGIKVKIIDLPTTMMDVQPGQEWMTDLINNLMLEILSTMAEQERLTIRSRQAEGIAVLKSNNGGKGIGRPSINVPKDFANTYDDWKAGKITATKAREILGLKTNTFYNLAKKHEQSIPKVDAKDNKN